MVNSKLKVTQLLQLVRRAARKQNLVLEELKGRGKGSHRLYAVIDASGTEVARMTLPDHPRDLSWPVLRQVESGLAHLFGEKWTEK